MHLFNWMNCYYPCFSSFLFVFFVFLHFSLFFFIFISFLCFSSEIRFVCTSSIGWIVLTLTIRRDNACLDFAGTDVILFPCHGEKGNQYWQYRWSKFENFRKRIPSEPFEIWEFEEIWEFKETNSFPAIWYLRIWNFFRILRKKISSQPFDIWEFEEIQEF